MKTRAEMLVHLPAARREAVERRTEELVLKEMTLREMRKGRGMSQKAVAAAMGTGQDVVSRLERRDDCLLSTMRSYVEAVGGSLKIVADVPGVGLVEIVPEDIRALSTLETSKPANCNGVEADPLQLARC